METAKVKSMEVNPSQAQAWLLKNTVNRPISKRIINYLVDQIRKNKWELTTDAIGFDTNGNLINGQHRLTAITLTGKTLPVLMASGLDPDAFNVIDTGKVRTSGDILGAHGYSSSHHKSAIIKFVMAFKKGYQSVGSSKSTGRTEMNISNQDVLNYANKHKKELAEAYDISVQSIKKFKGLKQRVIGGMYWILSEIDREYAISFFHQLSTGVGLKADDAIHVLREKLIADLGAKKKYPESDKIAWIVLAWNHFRKGNKLKKIQWAGTGNIPKPL